MLKNKLKTSLRYHLIPSGVSKYLNTRLHMSSSAGGETSWQECPLMHHQGGMGNVTLSNLQMHLCLEPRVPFIGLF